MFRASSCPSSGATTTAVAASGLPSERGVSSAVGRGWAGRPARPRQTALLSPRSVGKTRGCYCSCWAPDDGRQDNKLEKLLHLVGDLFEPWSKLGPCCIKPLACEVLVVSLHGKTYCKDWRLDIRNDWGRGAVQTLSYLGTSRGWNPT